MFVGPENPTPRKRLSSLLGFGAALLAIAIVTACGGPHPQSTIDTVTPGYGGLIDHLYRMIFWWAIFILVVVWGLLAYILIRFRDRPGAPEPTKTRGNLPLEIGWTLGPAIIIVLIAIPTIRAVFKTQAPAPEDALVVDVIGHQWFWEFRYPAQGVVTANELHLPVGRPVELRIRSADVIHSFWVPRLGGKRDANPVVREPEGKEWNPNRMIFKIDEPGVLLGQCAEFCGTGHGLMRLKVFAQTPDDFQAWVQAMKTPVVPDSGTLAFQGMQIFTSHVCVACHTINGTNAQGQIGPNLTRVGARTTIGANLLENTPANLERWIHDPDALKPGAKMPGAQVPGGGMPPTGLTDDQIKAVAAYLSSLK